MAFPARRRAIWEVIVVAAACYATARLGLLLQLPGTSVSAVWPASGIGLAAVLLLGPRVWPGITVAAFFTYSATLPLASVDDVVTAAVIAAGHTLEPLTAWALITRVSGTHNPFERAGYALWFGSSTVVAGIVSATIGVTALHLDGLISRDIYETAWLTWLVGHVAGMIVLAPAIYAWGRNRSLRVSVSRGVELAAMIGVSLLVGEMVFGRLGNVQVALSRPYLPVLLWAAFRFGQRETSTLGVIASVQAVAHTWAATSVPAAAGSATAMATLLLGASATPHDWLRALQFFLCSTVTVGLIVAAAVAERDKSKRELADSERRFRTVFEQAAVGVALVDSSTGRFLRVNQRYGDIVGYTPEQMCTLRFQEITHPEDLQSDLANLRRLNAGEQTSYSLEKRYLKQDGTAVWVSLTVSPMTPGKPSHNHITIVEDITPRKQAERELREINQTLEERVRERTSLMEIANRQMEEQIQERLKVERQLLASLEEKEILLREVHHRVKNNLSIISSLLYLEADTSGDVHTTRVLEQAQHRVRSMALAHEELHRSGNVADVDARQYFERLSSYLAQSYPLTSRKILIDIKVDPILFDHNTAISCGLIFTELLTNAFKHGFAANRSGTITVRVRANPNYTCALVVADDGAGIAREHMENEPSTLGLRLVKVLTNQLGGTFTINPKERGTDAVVEFPHVPFARA